MYTIFEIILLNKFSHLLFLQRWSSTSNLSPLKEHFWHPQVSPPFHILCMFCSLVSLLSTWWVGSDGFMGFFELSDFLTSEAWLIAVCSTNLSSNSSVSLVTGVLGGVFSYSIFSFRWSLNQDCYSCKKNSPQSFRSWLNSFWSIFEYFQ